MKNWTRRRAFALTIIATMYGCDGSEPEETGEEAEAEVELTDRVAIAPEALASLNLTYARAERVELAPSLEVPAELMPAPDRVASVGSRVAGRVVSVAVNTGDRVTQDQPLVTMESAEAGSAWADLMAARARESAAGQAMERQQRLHDSRVTSARAFEEAAAAFEVARAERQAAQTRLATFGADATGDPPDDPARLTLVSPIAGTVTARWTHPGDWVEPSNTILEVVDLSQLWLKAAVYEQEMRFVAVGQRVQVEVRALPENVFEGTVDRVEGTLDENTRSVNVRIVLPNLDRTLRPGMFATARIQATHDHEARNLLAIPWAAVQEIDGHQAVFVRVGEGEFELRSVHTAERAGDMVEILTGLEEGEEVVADGSFLLKGQLLRSTLAEEEH
jgi:cobalt-zinc-cadmium efflux system membrane fusion protein